MSELPGRLFTARPYFSLSISALDTVLHKVGAQHLLEVSLYRNLEGIAGILLATKS